MKLRGARGVQNSPLKIRGEKGSYQKENPHVKEISPLKIRGERGVIKERILISSGNVTGDSPNFRGLVKERPLILRWNLWKKLNY